MVCKKSSPLRTISLVFLRLGLALALLIGPSLAFLPSARADLTLGALDTGFDTGSGASNSVSAVAVQPDGKVLVGGVFTVMNGVVRNRIARLNADGTLDTTFDPGSGVNGQIEAFAVQSDGKVLIGGYFTTVNGVTRNRIARLT